MSEQIIDSQQTQAYYSIAEKMLDEKDSFGFMENIGIARILSEKNPALLAKVTFLKARGLLNFNQHKKLLDYLPEALEYNEGREKIKLLNYKGIALGYLGEFNRSKNIFLDLVKITKENDLLSETYTNLIWISLIEFKNQPDEMNLSKIKEYLDMAQLNYNALSNHAKVILNTNYSVYYFYKADYEKAIEILEKSINLCEEKYLPKIYNNLAEIYLKEDENGICRYVEEYTQKAEVIGSKYNDYLEVAKSFSTKAMAELREDQVLSALDTLYLALDYFKKAEAYPLAFDCLIKINEIVNDYKIDRLKSLKDDLKTKFKDTPFYDKI